MQSLGKTAAVILAAGTSSRMENGQNKLLLPLHGRPVLLYVIEAALRSQAEPVVLVLGHQASEVQDRIHSLLPDNPLRMVVNKDYLLGQSTSLHAGLQALLNSKGQEALHGVLFLLGDQPLISPSLLDRLIELHTNSGKRIALPLYQGQRGNPVVFAWDLVPELLTVGGDEGGRSILKRYPDEIATLTIDDVELNADVDTWEAYLALQRRGQPEREG